MGERAWAMMYMSEVTLRRHNDDLSILLLPA